jgi:hypothetical protein
MMQLNETDAAEESADKIISPEGIKEIINRLPNRKKT